MVLEESTTDEVSVAAERPETFSLGQDRSRSDWTQGDTWGLIRQLRTRHGELEIENRELRMVVAEKETRLQEIHHRVKNNLTVITSLLSLQARHIKDERARAALKECENRVRSIALLHARLYHSKNMEKVEFPAYVRGLVGGFHELYGIDRDALVIDSEIENIAVDLGIARPCGLKIHELVSNAIEHAFPRKKKGRITISFLKTSDSARLSVRDDGAGIPEHVDYMNPESLGLELVHALVEQLRGTLYVESRDGTAFTITFPFLS